MLTIISELMEADNQRSVDKIVAKYMDILSENQRYNLCRWGNSAKRRINWIDREKRKSFANLLN